MSIAKTMVQKWTITNLSALVQVNYMTKLYVPNRLDANACNGMDCVGRAAIHFVFCFDTLLYSCNILEGMNKVPIYLAMVYESVILNGSF